MPALQLKYFTLILHIHFQSKVKVFGIEGLGFIAGGVGCRVWRGYFGWDFLFWVFGLVVVWVFLVFVVWVFFSMKRHEKPDTNEILGVARQAKHSCVRTIKYLNICYIAPLCCNS